MLNINYPTRRAVLGLLIAVGGTYRTVGVHLYQVPHTFSPADVLADMTAIEATFTGYAVITPVVWGAIYDDPSGAAVVVGQLCLFVCTNSATPQDIFGYYLVAGGALVGQEDLPVPVPARQAFDGIPIVPQLSFAQ